MLSEDDTLHSYINFLNYLMFHCVTDAQSLQ